MTGSLQIQNEKYYMVINQYENGKRKPKWINTGLPVKGNKRAAQQMLNEYLVDGKKVEELSKRKRVASQGLTFLAYMGQWLETRKGNIEEGTYASYEGMINGRLTTFFKKENPLLADFSPEHLESFYQWLRKEKLSGNTLVHYHACIRKALDTAYKRNLVIENIADKVERPKKDKYHASFYDKNELYNLFEKSNDDPLGHATISTTADLYAHLESAGLAVMPVIVRNLDDDNAAIAMVDSNLEQREKLLFSEKAWAYRVKLEALNHSGIKGDMLSVDVLIEQTGESKNQIFRLVRLTELVPDLLDMVDDKKIAFNPAVELSYLTRKEQAILLNMMSKHEVTPSLSQAQRIKKESQSGDLTSTNLEFILAERKKESYKVTIAGCKLKQYFPCSYTPKQMETVIISLLENWQHRQVV